MNANELADELDGFLKEQEQLPWGTKQVYLDQAATMLRQQQAEIEAAKQLYLNAFERGKQIGYVEGMMNRPVNVQNVKEFTEHEQGKAMNNEPVAWILNGIIHEFDPSDWAKEQYPDQDVIPLYTQKNTRLHPFKTITDEEKKTNC